MNPRLMVDVAPVLPVPTVVVVVLLSVVSAGLDAGPPPLTWYRQSSLMSKIPPTIWLEVCLTFSYFVD